MLFAEFLPKLFCFSLIAEVFGIDLLVSVEDVVIRVLLLQSFEEEPVPDA